MRPDGPPWPRISIVTPSHNQGAFLEETIRSVLLQGYPNLQYVVIDGGSTDASVAILEKYAPWLDHWVSEPDRGQSHALNKGFARTDGEILAWLNSDDYYLPGALAHVAQAFARQGKEVGALVGTGHKINEDGEVVYTPDVPDLGYDAFLRWNMGYNFMQPACFFRRKAWEAGGPVCEDLYFCMDVKLWIEMAQYFRFERVEVSLAHAHIHEAAKTTAEVERMRAETAAMIASYEGGFEPAREVLLRQADALTATRKRLQRFTHHPLYRLASRLARALGLRRV
jgi:glycosyltransferase involved in cell wall biosynthesis